MPDTLYRNWGRPTATSVVLWKSTREWTSFTIMRSRQKWQILAGHWTIKLGRQNGKLFHWPKFSCVSKEVKLWKPLLRPAVCKPSLIVQWPARIFHFYGYCAWLCNWLITYSFLLQSVEKQQAHVVSLQSLTKPKPKNTVSKNFVFVKHRILTSEVDNEGG